MSGEQLDVLRKVGQQDMLGEARQWPLGVTWQPILDNFLLCLHNSLSLKSEFIYYERQI